MEESYVDLERHSRFVMLAKIRDNKTITVISALIKQARELPVELYKTLTWDRGAEMTNHTQFTVATDIKIYCCDPQSPWQRGSNETPNTLHTTATGNRVLSFSTNENCSGDLQCRCTLNFTMAAHS